MSDHDKMKRMMMSYELPTAPPEINRRVALRVKRWRRWVSLGLRLAAMGGAGLIVLLCWALAAWKPAQNVAAIVYSNCGFLIPTSLTGLIWYSAIWVVVALTIFGATLLVTSGLRTLEE